MMRLTIGLLILAACSTPPARPDTPQANQGPEVAAIRAVLEEFRRAIVARDGDAILRIVVSPDVPFRSRDVDNGELHASTAGEFARTVADAKKALEERFSNVQISEREGIAVLDSDYQFSVDSQVTNHGREVWTLIRTPEGWKITMVLWSRQRER